MEVKLWNFNVKSQDVTEPIKLSYMSERILFIFAFTVEITGFANAFDSCYVKMYTKRIIIHVSEEKIKERKYLGL